MAKEYEKKILEMIRSHHSLSDTRLCELLEDVSLLSVVATCRGFSKLGLIKRSKESDGLIYNQIQQNNFTHDENIKREEMIHFLSQFLSRDGWYIRFAAVLNHRGIGVIAEKNSVKWYIAVKGSGLAERICYENFIHGLGKILFSMKEPSSKFSIAVPDTKTYRSLWDKLPLLAKQRTGISILFGHSNGVFEEVA